MHTRTIEQYAQQCEEQRLAAIMNKDVLEHMDFDDEEDYFDFAVSLSKMQMMVL